MSAGLPPLGFDMMLRVDSVSFIGFIISGNYADGSRRGESSPSMGRAGLHPRPLMRPAETGGFGLVDGGGVEFALGGVYDGFVVALVEREVVYFLAAQSVYVALDHWVVAYFFVLVDFDVLTLSTIFMCVIFNVISFLQ